MTPSTPDAPYTPTTPTIADLRQSWIRHRLDPEWFGSENFGRGDAIGAEFDRAMAAHDAEVKAATRAQQYAATRTALAGAIEAAQHPNHVNEVGPDALDEWCIADALLASGGPLVDVREIIEEIESAKPNPEANSEYSHGVKQGLDTALYRIKALIEARE